jgi:beta-N-acetylhexosaminidase
MPETELRAGRVFSAAIRAGSPNARSVMIGPAASPGLLDSLQRMAEDAERVVLAAYVRRIEGEGRPSIPAHIAEWMERVAAADAMTPSAKVAMIAFGNPYLVRQVPSVATYLVTFGVGDALENAAAQAILGRAPIGGVSPVSLPGFFTRGDGLRRPATTATPSR